jgi:hypothetical protein
MIKATKYLEAISVISLYLRSSIISKKTTKTFYL